MSSALLYSVLSTALVSLVALVGLITISLKRNWLDKVLFILISLSAGALLGDVFFHLLPEMVKERGELTVTISSLVLLGIVGFFILEKFVIWHHHHSIETPDEHAHQRHGHDHSLGTMNLIGDGLHNLLDGMIIGASFLISPVVGVGTTIAVILHEIPQEIGDFGVLIHGGFSRTKALLLNFLSALTAIAGAVIALLLGSVMQNATLFIAPFAAGVFIYIAGSDLIPELHKEDDALKSFIELIAFLIGILVMLALLLIE